MINLSSLCGLKEYNRTNNKLGLAIRKAHRGFFKNPAGRKISPVRQDRGSADLKYQRNGETPQAELPPFIALK